MRYSYGFRATVGDVGARGELFQAISFRLGGVFLGRFFVSAVYINTYSTLHFSIYFAAFSTGSVGTHPMVLSSFGTTKIPLSPFSRVLYAVKVYPGGNAFVSSTDYLRPSFPGEWCLFSKDSTKMGRSVFSAGPGVKAFALSLMCVLVPLHTSTGTAY